MKTACVGQRMEKERKSEEESRGEKRAAASLWQTVSGGVRGEKRTGLQYVNAEEGRSVTSESLVGEG